MLVKELERTLIDSGEIDLLVLGRTLWNGKKVILLSTIIAVVLAYIYLLLSPRTYQASALFTAPKLGQVDLYNQGRSAMGISAQNNNTGISYLTASDVYKIFLRQLRSESLRNKFIDEIYIPSLKSQPDRFEIIQIREKFSKIISIKQADPRRDEGLYEVSAFSETPELSYKWLNDFISIATLSTKAEIRSGLVSEAKNQLASIDLQMKALRYRAEEQRKDQIMQYEEALRIATAAGLESSNLILSGKGTDDSLLYLHGAKVLRQRLASLKGRINNDAFIEGLNDLKRRSFILSSLHFDDKDISLVSYEEEAEVPLKPVKPKKLLVLVISILLGGFLGIVFVLIRNNYTRKIG